MKFNWRFTADHHASGAESASFGHSGSDWKSGIRTGGYGSDRRVVDGKFWTAARQAAIAWITRGLVHFVASDAHNLTSRPHRLRAAYDVVRAEFGEEKQRRCS